VILHTLGGCQSASAPQQGSLGDEEDHAFQVDEIPPLSPVSLGAGERLRVVATTSVVADVVHNVGGDRIELKVLMPRGADPHSFEPTPQDVAAVVDAHVVFANGVGLEAFLDPLIESAGAEGKVAPVSVGVELLSLDEEHEHEGGESEEEHERGEYDPHVWFDPKNVQVWVSNIAQVLQALDPDHADLYAENAAAYEAELLALHDWILEQVDQLPAARRQLVTDHTSLAYFAQRYGFDQIGAVFPGLSTLSEPSAQELAALQERIQEHRVKAIFVGTTVNPNLAQQVAHDTGVQIAFLYTGSLSAAGGPADTYLAMMRYNVTAIVEGLR
jgi:ABC-type Zn uptake system ZnuABC Zn-binding protein ZnuA